MGAEGAQPECSLRARFAPTQRRTHRNTDRYPNGFVCRNKNDRADRRANANPIFAMISIFRFTVHGYSTVTDFFEHVGFPLF